MNSLKRFCTDKELALLPEDEKQRIVIELDKPWEDMNPLACVSELGKEIVDRVMRWRYHRDEHFAGIL